MDRYFLRDILIFLTYLATVQWGMYIERSYGCTPAQDVLDFTPRCYSLPIVEDRVEDRVEYRVPPDPNGCPYSHDGCCDEAGRGGSGECQAGTDTTDCDRPNTVK